MKDIHHLDLGQPKTSCNQVSNVRVKSEKLGSCRTVLELHEVLLKSFDMLGKVWEEVSDAQQIMPLINAPEEGIELDQPSKL